jgi:putative ABC transport system permease protein
VPVGLLLGVVSVRILGLFFTLPPPTLTIPAGPLAALVLVLVAASAVGLGAALAAIGRTSAASTLREP